LKKKKEKKKKKKKEVKTEGEVPSLAPCESEQGKDKIDTITFLVNVIGFLWQLILALLSLYYIKRRLIHHFNQLHRTNTDSS